MPKWSILFLFSLSAILAAQGSSSDPAISRAADLLRNGKPGEAEQLLQPLTKAEPGNAAAWNLLEKLRRSDDMLPEDRESSAMWPLD